MGKVKVVSSSKADFKPVKITIELEIESLNEYQIIKTDLKDTLDNWEFVSSALTDLISELDKKI